MNKMRCCTNPAITVHIFNVTDFPAPCLYSNELFLKCSYSTRTCRVMYTIRAWHVDCLVSKSEHVIWLKIPQLKPGNIRVIFPHFSEITRAFDKHNSSKREKKYVLRYLHLDFKLFSKLTVFLEVCFYCSLLRTDNIRGLISERIFAPSRGYGSFQKQASWSWQLVKL